MLFLLLLLRLERGLSTDAPIRPLLAPWYRMLEDGDRLLFEYGRSVVVFEGGGVRTLLKALLPLLDGTRSADELVALLGPSARPAVEQALDLLAENGVLVEGPDIGDVGAHALAAAYRIAPSIAAERLGAATVGIVGSARAGHEVARLLLLAGLHDVQRLDWAGQANVALAVVAPAGDEAGELPSWNRRALADGVAWLPVRPYDGRVSMIGPLILPGETCCHECLLLRLSGHVEYGRDLGAIEARSTMAQPGHALDAAAAALTAHLALGWACGIDSTLPGVLHVLEARPSLSLTTHAVLRVPRCPACSPVERLAGSLPWHEATAA